MKTTKTLTIKNTILATFAVAGLVAGTAACGGKNNDSADAEKQALVELLLAAAQSGDADEIADALAEAGPDLVAQIVPELAPEVAPDELVAPEMEVTPEEVTPEVTPDEAAPEAEEAAPEVVTPEEESTPEEVAPEEDAAPEGDDSSRPGFDFDFDVDFPVVTMPTITITPEITGALVLPDGSNYRASIFIDENSPLLLADITSVTVSYRYTVAGLSVPVTKPATISSDNGSDSVWTIQGLKVSVGQTLVITATNRSGNSDTYEVTVAETVLL